ncbi:unnamed protein product [Bemisia tabaci]|uniref:Uncharacterized protein n=2 Tax=Bemisia tabaci TaxID=7038 RepID=A0A9P0A177_BEMTA|nr:unnamed protein product [Bemisia tabaci]
MKNSLLRCRCMKFAKVSHLSFSQSSQNILNSGPSLMINDSGSQTVKKKRGKTSSTFCIPVLDTSFIQELSSVVAVNLRLDSISWSKLCRKDNLLSDWGIVHLPHDIIRMDPIKLFELLQSIYEKLPTADIYVMEQIKQRQGSKNPGTNVAFMMRLQILSMLIPMLSARRPSPFSEENDTSVSRIALLKPYLASRLFNLLVADEQIAVEPIVKKMLNNEPSRTHSPLKISDDARHSYQGGRSAFDRENMGVALLMNVTFMELLVYANPSSHTILLKNFDDFVRR